MFPTPRLWKDRWYVDLRHWGFGQRYALTAATKEEAVNAAWAKLRELERATRHPVIQAAAGAAAMAVDAPATFGEAVDRWLAQKQWRRAGGQEWGTDYAAYLKKELGHVPLAAFIVPAGHAVLLAYRHRVRGSGRSAATCENLLSVAKQTLALCCLYGWLPGMPIIPRATNPGEPARAVRSDTITEVQFRALRDLAFDTGPRGISKAINHFKTADAYLAYAAVRRLYLSVGYYTGMHDIDVSGLLGEHVSDRDFIRTNSKSSRVIEREPMELPEGLARDLDTERERLGRDFRPDELVTGGPWPKHDEAIKRGAERAGIADWKRTNSRSTFRRSVVRNLAICAWTEREIAEYLGHVDQRMIREVYRHLSVQRFRSPVRVPWTYDNVTRMPWRLKRPDRQTSSGFAAFTQEAAPGVP